MVRRGCWGGRERVPGWLGGEPSCCGLGSPEHPPLLSHHFPTSVPISRPGPCFPVLPRPPDTAVALPPVLPAWSEVQPQPPAPGLPQPNQQTPQAATRTCRRAESPSF